MQMALTAEIPGSPGSNPPPPLMRKSADDPYSSEQISSFGLVPGQLPQHIAIIMDGNGRWAASRGLPRIEGHRRGVGTV